MRWASLALSFPLLASGCSRPKPQPERHFVAYRGDTLWVEVAATPAERARGLSGRPNLAPDSGMLFVFEETRVVRFWMRDTRFPLSIAFLDENFVVVDTQDMEPFSEQVHTSRAPARYAVEAPLGWFRDRGIGPGDTLVVK
mgnify:CR=1 FL=1